MQSRARSHPKLLALMFVAAALMIVGVVERVENVLHTSECHAEAHRAQTPAESTPLDRADVVIGLEPVDSDPRRLTLRATFTNHDDGAVHILRPVNGSLDSATLPFYQLTFYDTHGLAWPHQPLGFRCGHTRALENRGRWPDDIVVRIEAGETASVDIETDLDPSIPPGVYRVGLDYEFWHEGRTIYGDHAMPKGRVLRRATSDLLRYEVR